MAERRRWSPFRNEELNKRIEETNKAIDATTGAIYEIISTLGGMGLISTDPEFKPLPPDADKEMRDAWNRQVVETLDRNIAALNENNQQPPIQEGDA